MATALLAKKPQIISPVMFDQEFWAELLLWKELAVRCSSLNKLKAKELVSALRSACSVDMMEKVEETACELLKENGVELALTQMKKLLTTAALSTSVSMA